MKKELYIIAGHNGAGKTTFLKGFVKYKNIRYIDADEISKGISTDKFSLLTIKAGKIALKRMEQFKRDKEAFAIETTFSGKMWQAIIDNFKKSNYWITVFFIYLNSPEEAVKRIGVRINKRGHYVSKEVVFRRYFRSIKNFWFIYKSLVDSWFLINNSGDTPFLVAFGKGKDYELTDKENFKRFLSIVKEKENQ